MKIEHFQCQKLSTSASSWVDSDFQTSMGGVFNLSSIHTEMYNGKLAICLGLLGAGVSVLSNVHSTLKR